MIVAEAYLHFEHRPGTPPMREVGELAFPIVERAAREFLDRFEYERRAEVVVEEGNLRLRGRIGVTAAALLGGFIAYGGVRESIDYARHDGKIAAGWINDRIQDTLSLEGGDIIARRRFTPAPTRLRRLFDDVAAGRLTPAAATAEADKLLREYGEDAQTVQSLMHALAGELAAVIPVEEQPGPPKLPRSTEPRTGILRGKRPSLFRDRTGIVRIVDD